MRKKSIIRTTISLVALSIMLGGVTGCSNTNTLQETDVNFIQQIENKNDEDWAKTQGYNINEQVEIIGGKKTTDELTQEEAQKYGIKGKTSEVTGRQYELNGSDKEKNNASSRTLDTINSSVKAGTNEVLEAVGRDKNEETGTDTVNIDGTLRINGREYVAGTKDAEVKITTGKEKVASGKYSENINKLIEEYTGATMDDTLHGNNDVLKHIDEIHKEGLYVLFADKKLYFVTKDEYTNYCKQHTVYQEKWNEYGEDDSLSVLAKFYGGKLETEIYDSIVLPLNAQLVEQKSKEKEDLYKSFIKENTNGGVAKYVNTLNPGSYVIKDGFIVQDDTGVAYMNELEAKLGNRTAEEKCYKPVELMVFFLNNPSAIKSEDISTKKGTFSWIDGAPNWIDRDWENSWTVDALGEVMYPNCFKSFEEFRSKCGGTLIAFKGWGNSKQDQRTFEGPYNEVTKGSKTKEQYYGYFHDRG